MLKWEHFFMICSSSPLLHTCPTNFFFFGDRHSDWHSRSFVNLAVRFSDSTPSYSFLFRLACICHVSLRRSAIWGHSCRTCSAVMSAKPEWHRLVVPNWILVCIWCLNLLWLVWSQRMITCSLLDRWKYPFYKFRLPFPN
jgi:hypothetical protein